MNKEIIINSQRQKFILLIGFIIILLGQLYVKTSSISYMLLSYAILFILALVNDDFIIFYISFLLLSDNNIFDLGGLSIQLLLMFIYQIKLFSKGRVKLPKFVFFFCVAISIYCLIYYKYSLFNTLQGIKLSLLILSLTEFLSVDNKCSYSVYKKLLDSCFYGVIMSIIAAIIINPEILNQSRFALSEDSNWNVLGILSAILFSHYLTLFFRKGDNLLKVIISAICALLTTSRTALLVMVCSLIWCFLSRSKSKKRFFIKAVFIFLFVTFIYLIYSGIIEIKYVNILLDRILNPRRGDISNGRFTLWSKYINYLLTNKNILLFGCGTPLINGITTNTSNLDFVAHNMFIEQFVMYGFFGNIIITLLYANSYKTIKKQNLVTKNKTEKFYLINILIIFISGFFSHVLTSVVVTFELYLGIMQYISMQKEEEKI